MFVKSQTVTVNAAFLKEIKEENDELVRLLDELRDLCSADVSAVVEPERFSELLNSLRDQLALHFSLEECLGYFDDPAEVDPNFSTTADRLRSQHQDLYREINKITEIAADLLYPWIDGPSLPETVKRYLRFHQQLSEHERRELELIWNVHQIDLGGES